MQLPLAEIMSTCRLTLPQKPQLVRKSALQRAWKKASVTDSTCVAGFILERIHGHNSDKRIGKPTFHDITYVRQLLFSTFKALHAAQRQLAFHHADLRLANIMEVSPSVSAAPVNSRRMTNPMSSNNIGVQAGTFHHAKSDSAQDTAMPSTADLTSNPSAIPSVSHQQPHSPNQWEQTQHDQIMHHFKIIDYGLADFKELFGAGYVRSDNGHRHKRKVNLYRGSSLGKMAVPVTNDEEAAETAPAADGYMRAARPVGCVAFLPHPSNLLPQVASVCFLPPDLLASCQCACLHAASERGLPVRLFTFSADCLPVAFNTALLQDRSTLLLQCSTTFH